ncbi:type IV toxin-antitoxin system AbiEi family antitoxin domain-containing protein [Micromonospora zhanjiangensis]|uniref:Type IV toxin-antitoxin system AbiEi family antitoxin domain-containing protein n=1 Tax=Micromonospora zhanjiangensis TaxID=1522057 RepID=A0ABV8KHQ4_9ACTN
MFDELVARQHGVVTRQQAYAAGLTRAQIEARLRSGRWQRMIGWTYATFSGVPPRRAVLWAVVLRAGRGATLSHETAAELQGLTDRPAPLVHVTVPAGRRVEPMSGVVVHHAAAIDRARHPTRLPPQTRIEETALDLAQRARTLDEAVGWLSRACGGRLTTASRLLRAMAVRARVRWRAELTAALGDVADGCHSLLELRYLRGVERAHGLPTGERQAARSRRGGRWYDDVRYRRYGTRVELDGRAAHPVDRRRRDARRDNAAAVNGETTLRYGWSDATTGACDTAAEVATVLRRNGWVGRPRPCRTDCPAPTQTR